MEADGRPQKKPTSPWVYVGCGCAALVLLAWRARSTREVVE